MGLGLGFGLGPAAVLADGSIGRYREVIGRSREIEGGRGRQRKAYARRQLLQMESAAQHAWRRRVRRTAGLPPRDIPPHLLAPESPPLPIAALVRVGVGVRVGVRVRVGVGARVKVRCTIAG